MTADLLFPKSPYLALLLISFWLPYESSLKQESSAGQKWMLTDDVLSNRCSDVKLFIVRGFH